jgi:hypothetical protein
MLNPASNNGALSGSRKLSALSMPAIQASDFATKGFFRIACQEAMTQ